ncbi:hypothetical protein SC1_03452 [Sphingopyxis sp. C-1]|nr:hypothetical protein SC1_03452 [Sphingopyxis sp. C-1]
MGWAEFKTGQRHETSPWYMIWSLSPRFPNERQSSRCC